MTDEWVTSEQMLRAFKAGYGGGMGISPVLDRIRAGAIRATAQTLIVDRKPVEAGEIAPQYWRGVIEKQEWRLGDFTILTQPSAYRYVRVEAFGVQFRREDVEAMGGVFNVPEKPPAPEQPPRMNETVEEYAVRMVDRGIRIKGFTGAVLAASWNGPAETVPLVKDAQGALLAEWKKRGEGTRGRQPKDKDVK